MTRAILFHAIVAVIVVQHSARADCPAGYPDEILCENFDTYCTGGGHPGDPECAPGAVLDENLMRQVWTQVSTNEGTGAPCGTPATVESNAFYVTSPPFGGKYPGAKTDFLAQHAFRDWQAPNPDDLSRLIQNVHNQDAVIGTDARPLVLTFALDSEVPGKIFYSNNYIELSYGAPSPANRANTDYVLSPNCATYCNPYINQGPFPIVCAVANPETAMPAGCPSIGTTPPPIRNAIAIGLLAMMDPDPCHCGSSQAHGGTNWHLNFFNGQVWYMLRSNTPRPSTGTVTPLNGAAMPPPSDIHVPGKFTLWHDPLQGDTPVGVPFNWVTLTIKTSTVKIEMRTLETSKLYPGSQYEVYNVMDDIPLDYFGPFDTIRMGVGPGCRLASNTSWETCASGTNRTCLDSKSNQSRFVNFDDLVLYGGVGFKLPGACCLTDGSCLDDVLQADCEAQGGTFQGFSSTCDTSVCCPTPFADADHDDDVDQADFARFQRCLTTGGGPSPAVCLCFDRDGDSDVDDRDFVEFANCATGPDMSLSADPPPSCRP